MLVAAGAEAEEPPRPVVDAIEGEVDALTNSMALLQVQLEEIADAVINGKKDKKDKDKDED